VKKILFLAHRIPYPPNKGDKIRSFHEVKFLSNLGDIYLGALVDNKSDWQYAKELNKWCKELLLVPLNPRRKKLSSLRGMLTRTPMSVHYFYDRSLQKFTDDLLASNTFDVIFCFSSPMAEYIFRCDSLASHKTSESPLLIMDFCDVDSQKWKEYAQVSRWPLAKLYEQEASLLAKYERKVAEFFDFSIFISSKEKKLFEQTNPGLDSHILTIGNGVDLEYFRPSKDHPGTEATPCLLFTGAMDYYANVDGICWFKKEVWPIIKKEFPNTIFYIVGANPASEIKKMHNGSDIIVTGYVEDIRPFYQKATVCVIPLRIARGIQNKVLEAMAMAKPVVCTPVAFEGIEAKPGEDLITAFSPKEFAISVTELLKNAQKRKRLAFNARECIKRHYHWETQLSPLKRLIMGYNDHQESSMKQHAYCSHQRAFGDTIA